MREPYDYRRAGTKREIVVRGKQCWVLHTFDYEDIVAHVHALDAGATVIHVKKGAA